MSESFVLEDFDELRFLTEYWQQKPCLIKQFVPNFVDPIDENDLAGLAQESAVDSRIVSQQQGQWTVAQGPFEEFETHCVGDWSLLVQGVDRYIGDVSKLANKVDFLPNWRFDDVMVSYSTANAGVGAHIDEYDVFIVQGRGSRRWQVGLPASRNNNADSAFPSITPHPLLKQIEGFDPVIDYVMSPGDAIYIPPKHPHKGIALEACINYSLGFRAPTNLEVLSGMLDETVELQDIQKRYNDPDLSILRNAELPKALISEKELSKLKQDLLALLHSDQANQALLQYLSRQELPEADVSEFEPYTAKDVMQLLEENAAIELMPGVKPIYQHRKGQADGPFCFYVDGAEYSVVNALREPIEIILNGEQLSGFPSEADTKNLQNSWISLLTQLLNSNAIDLIEIE